MEKQKFNTYGFMGWLGEEFTNCVDNHWNFDLVENVIEHGLEHHESMESFCRWLCNMLPEVNLSEIKRFVC